MLLRTSFSELAAGGEGLVPGLPDASCVVIGNFDGVHLGHQSLFARARQLQLPVLALTFDPHPREVLSSTPPPRLLGTEARCDLLRAAGAQHIVLLAFSRELAARTTEDFVRCVLLERLHARRLVLGYDFVLGKNRAGNAATLRALGETLGFAVDQCPALHTPDGAIISSTSIRNALLAGDVETAACQLGRAHSVRGVIIHGRSRGKGLGFPTANLDPALPGMAAIRLAKPGVYATRVALPAPGRALPAASLRTPACGTQADGSTVYPAVTNIGHNPTFGINALSAETHIPGLSADLYDLPMELFFMHRLRDERRFANLTALQSQLREDTRQALALAG